MPRPYGRVSRARICLRHSFEPCADVEFSSRNRLTGQLVFTVLIMSLFVIARHFTGKLDRVRCATLENTALLVYYTTAQALVGLVVIHGFPRMIL